MDRLFREIEKRLTAKVTKHYRSYNLGKFEDNKTQMEGTKLLADVLGVRKNQVDVNLGVQPGGFGVLVVPGPSPSKSDWATAAAEQQAKLPGPDEQES